MNVQAVLNAIQPAIIVYLQPLGVQGTQNLGLFCPLNYRNAASSRDVETTKVSLVGLAVPHC